MTAKEPQLRATENRTIPVLDGIPKIERIVTVKFYNMKKKSASIALLLLGFWCLYYVSAQYFSESISFIASEERITLPDIVASGVETVNLSCDVVTDTTPCFDSFVFDTAVSGLRIHEDLDDDRYLKKIGKPCDDSKEIAFLNADQTQFLIMRRAYGDGCLTFNSFEITMDMPAYASFDTFHTDIKKFVTSARLSLSSQPDHVLRKIGKPTEVLQNGSTMTIVYRAESIETSCFLQRYNMPIYLAEYHFEKGVLHRIFIGFEDP